MNIKERVVNMVALQLHIWLGVGRRYQHQPELESREKALKQAANLYQKRGAK